MLVSSWSKGLTLPRVLPGPGNIPRGKNSRKLAALWVLLRAPRVGLRGPGFIWRIFSGAESPKIWCGIYNGTLPEYAWSPCMLLEHLCCGGGPALPVTLVALRVLYTRGYSVTLAGRRSCWSGTRIAGADPLCVRLVAVSPRMVLSAIFRDSVGDGH